MVDIHSHIVWGVDDGSPNLDISLAMLEAAWKAGTTDIVATPHSNARYTYDTELITQRIAELNTRTGNRPKIHRGCDFHLSFDNIDHLLEKPSVYTVNGKRYLLVECPDFHVGKHTDTVLERLMDAGVVPIVTHPERNPVLQHDLARVESWAESGCLVQVTALSVTGGFGSAAKTAGTRLLDRGAVHIIASDAHDPEHRHPRLDEAYQVIRARYGAEAAECLFHENPRAVIDDVPLAAGKQKFEGGSRKWWRFW